MDPLSDVLALLRPSVLVCGGFDVGGAFCVKFPPHDGIKCYAVVSGRSWLAVEGAPPMEIHAGDCFLLPRGVPFRLASDLSLPATDALSFHNAHRRNGEVTVFNGGGDCFTVGGYFRLEGRHAALLLEQLPLVVHLRQETDRAAFRWLLERMMAELREARPGGELILANLVSTMMVQALRLQVTRPTAGGVGWLTALADEQVGRALGALHDDPGRRWTLADLAREAGMSRSSFAQRFKQTVGASALDYLTRWRMAQAGERLIKLREPVAEVAPALGYESESAFSAAFKRVMGCSPRQYVAQNSN